MCMCGWSVFLSACCCRPKDKKFSQKKNPLKNLNIMLRLNPHAKTFRRRQMLMEMERRKANTKEKKNN